MRVTYRRLDHGEPIRQAMARGGWRLQSLAAHTQEIDPEGRGVCFQLVAFLATGRDWARETCSPRSAQLLAKALGVPEDELFIPETSGTPGGSAQHREN